MHFSPIIEEWGVAEMAADLGLPTKNVRRWVDLDSIPADWFAPLARCARRRKMPHVTEKYLAAVAERRRLAKSDDSRAQDAA